VRWRLATLYGAMFLVSGAVLLAITYGLVSHAAVAGTRSIISPYTAATAPSQTPVQMFFKRSRVTTVQLPPGVRRLLLSPNGRAVVRLIGTRQRISDLHQLEIESAIALGIMTLLAGGLGWLIAGRVLAPLRAITSATREISAASLDRRLALPGPRDELRELADTIDGLLARLQASFDAQRRFVANASHELRTPLASERALLEMVMSDPRASVQTFRDTCRMVLEENEHQEQLIDALLTLARGQRAPARPEPVALDALAGAVIADRRAEAQERGLQVTAALEPVSVDGDPRLLERLVSNLVDNALRHNAAGGRVTVTVGAPGGLAWLTVANTGPVVDAAEVGRLLEPFTRGRDRVGSGLGLGLSIVAAIAEAHGAALALAPGADGGLEITVQFTASAAGRARPVTSPALAG
jgi:signal transduction histidine kinase